MTRYKFRGVKTLEFVDRFRTEKDCLFYVSEIKWQNGPNAIYILPAANTRIGK